MDQTSPTQQQARRTPPKKRRTRRRPTPPTARAGLDAAVAALETSAASLRAGIVADLESGETKRPMRDMTTLEQLNALIADLGARRAQWAELEAEIRRTRRNRKSATPKQTPAAKKTGKKATPKPAGEEPVTPYAVLRREILRTLADAPPQGAAAAEVVAGVGKRLEGAFTQGDLRPSSTYPARWMAACHVAKSYLVREGLIDKPRPKSHGRWTLTGAGREAAAEI